MAKFYMKPSVMDPDNSWSVFERGRVNEFGEPYCVAPALSFFEAADMVHAKNGGGFYLGKVEVR